MAERPFRLPLTAIHVAAVATLMRSVALDRWITVAACVLLLVGSLAADRGRTWGVALSAMLGVTFMSIVGLGIAPPWFAVLGFLAVRPFLRMLRHFVGFDRGATALLAAGVAGLGYAGAAAWKAYAFALFAAIPMLTPSFYFGHGVLVATIGVAASVAGLMRTRSRRDDRAFATEGVQPLGEASRYRVATGDEQTRRIADVFGEDDALAEMSDGEVAAPLGDAQRRASLSNPNTK